MMTDNNALVSGNLVEQFNLDMMVPQGARGAPKLSEETPFLLPVTITKEIPETSTKIFGRGSTGSMVELKDTLIHQQQIPGHH